MPYKVSVIGTRPEEIFDAEIAARAEDRFRLYFQPIAPLNDKDKGVHFEILLRLEDKQKNGGGNMIGPDAFLPAAEHYNISGKIDQWVETLRERGACFRSTISEPVCRASSI